LLINERQFGVFHQGGTLHVAFTLTHKFAVHSLMNVLSPLLTEGLQVL